MLTSKLTYDLANFMWFGLDALKTHEKTGFLHMQKQRRRSAVQ